MAACRGLTIGASEETAHPAVFVKPHRLLLSQNDAGDQSHPHAAIMAMLAREGRSGVDHPSASRLYLFHAENVTYPLVLCSGICAGEGESIPLILLEEPGPFRQDIIAALEAARVPGIWPTAPRRSRGESGGESRAGVTARPVEMMSPDLRVAGISDGLPACRIPGTSSAAIRRR
jgi:hypothetical protein